MSAGTYLAIALYLVIPALTADCSVCGQEFPHYHRDTPDGEEIVRPPAGPPLDAERLARDEALLLMSTVSASIKHYLRTGFVADDPLIRGLRRIHNKLIRIWQLDAAAYDAERQGES